LLTGRGAFVDDLTLPGQLHMAVWRSPLAHARVLRVNLDPALAAPGVVDAFDVGAFGPSPPTFATVVSHRSLRLSPQHPLASTRVRYVGEAVAVVLAETRALAEDALYLVEVDLAPMPVLTCTGDALASGAPRLHEGASNNCCANWTERLGDPEAAFSTAFLVVRERLSMQRYTGVPIETRGVLAGLDQVSGELVIWASGQWPHTTRALTARMLGMAVEQIRVITPDVGGGFGVKEELYPEDVLVPFAARRTGRAVKWIEDRREHFTSVVHAREQTHELELALAADGAILGLRDRIVTDMGAYVRALGVVNPSLAAASLPGPYRIPAIQIDSVAVLTNKSPTSAYRGAGQPEATYARERLLDIAAQRLGMDPAQLRFRNLLPPESLPYDTRIDSVDGRMRFDSGDFPTALRLALECAGYEQRRADQAVARRSGKLPGIGVAVYAQITGTGPYEGADIRVGSDGSITVSTGAVDIGQGLTTALAQVVGAELGVDLARIRVVAGDTARIPHGVGTYASRGAVMAGNAVAAAARELRDKALQTAAALLEVAPHDLEWIQGAARVRGAAGRSVSLAELADALKPGSSRRPPALQPTLESRQYFESEDPPVAYGVHVVALNIDGETGAVQLQRYIVVNDAGRLINPTLAEGQIVGGLVQGLGGALFEQLAYDENGQLVSSSLLDYALPRAADLVNVEVRHLEIPSPLNPLGVKGLGEGGAVGAHAAVANAVADALAPLGVTVWETPLTARAVRALVAH
jgi:carbon-monoxide dehydrogenase large subunit